MKISFCGHGKVHNDYDYVLKQELLKQVKNLAKGEDVIFYLGNYGDFDHFVYKCCKEFKEEYPKTKLIFVTPYIDEIYLKNRNDFSKKCDETIYPDIENTPKRYAILKCNEWKVNNTDVIIAYIQYTWGGAYKTFEYALRKKKKVINLYKNED